MEENGRGRGEAASPEVGQTERDRDRGEEEMERRWEVHLAEVGGGSGRGSSLKRTGYPGDSPGQHQVF